MRKSHKQKTNDKKYKRWENELIKNLSQQMSDKMDNQIIEECILQEQLLKHWRI